MVDVQDLLTCMPFIDIHCQSNGNQTWLPAVLEVLKGCNNILWFHTNFMRWMIHIARFCNENQPLKKTGVNTTYDSQNIKRPCKLLSSHLRWFTCRPVHRELQAPFVSSHRRHRDLRDLPWPWDLWDPWEPWDLWEPWHVPWRRCQRRPLLVPTNRVRFTAASTTSGLAKGRAKLGQRAHESASLYRVGLRYRSLLHPCELRPPFKEEKHIYIYIYIYIYLFFPYININK